MTAVTDHKTLFQLSAAWVELVAALEDAGGELTPELQAIWDGLMADLGQSVDRYGHVLKSLELQAIAHRDRAQYHAAAAQAREHAQKRLKERLATTMQTLGVRKLAGEDFTGYLKTSEAVLIEDESRLPDEAWRVKREVDRAAIRDALKAGKTIPGASLEARESAYIK
jgi:hypothetical protein